MRKLAEKVVIIAQICITLVFAVVTMLSLSNNFPQTEGAEYYLEFNGVLKGLIFVLFLLYLGLSAYLIYVNFSANENIKRVLLFCDSESATHASARVVRDVVTECVKQTEGIQVKRIKLRADDKKGFVMTLKIWVNADNVSQTVDKFRCLLTDCFANALGMTFNSINFELAKVNAGYLPDVGEAEENAEKLSDQREITTQIYNEPLDNDLHLDCAQNGEQPSQDKSD